MSIKTSAEKVKVAIAKHTASCQDEVKASIKTHQCTPVKIPRMPAKLSHLFPKAVKEIAKRKADLVSADWNPEVQHTHDFGTHVDTTNPPGADLIPARVKRWTLKEYHLVARKIKGMGKTRDTARRFDITILTNEDTNLKNDRSADALWEEMIKAKEERHFHLGRITNLSS